MTKKIKKFDIPHDLIIQAVNGDNEARVEFITRADFYLRNYVRWNHKKWSLASHPYIDDFTSDFILAMWRNPGRWVKSKNPIGHILFFFRYEAWSALVWRKKYNEKIERVKEDLDEIDLMEWYAKDDTIQIIDLFIDIDIYLASIKKPVYILDAQWTTIKNETKEFFKILKDDTYEAKYGQSEFGSFTQELIYHISRTLLDKCSNKYL